MQFGTRQKPPVGILFDSDMGNSIDAALALALLYGFEGKEEARVASLSVSKPNLKAAAYCDVMARFYTPMNPRFAMFARSIPIGLADGGRFPEDTPMLTAALARKDAEGKPAFVNNIHKLNDTAEVDALMRNALTAQYDRNAIVVLAGPATDLVKLLDLEGARDLIARKVRFLSAALGAFPDGAPDPRIQADIPAAKRLFAEWPTPIVVAGREVGDAVLYPAASIEKDFAWAPAHPVVEAYRAYRPMPYDAPTRDMSAVLYAVRPKEGYFGLSEPGALQVRDDGSLKFSPSPGGRHRRLLVDPAQKERILKVYTEVASARPVPRKPRFLLPKDKKEPPASKAPDATTSGK